jgi:signal peptidase I
VRTLPCVNDNADSDVSKKIASRGRWSGWPLTILLTVLLTLFVRDVLVQQFIVEGSSMRPTLDGGERVLVNRVAYRFGEPAQGDLVVASVSGQDGVRLDVIKRVIGLPGEMVEVRGCRVFVDGQSVEIAEQPYLCGPSTAPLQVPANHVFILGDNRGGSYDSRFFGPVPLGDVVGRVDIVLWPPSAWSTP